MPSHGKTHARNHLKAVPTRTSSEKNAVDLLVADHKKVQKLFKLFEKLAKEGDVAGKVEVATQICQELKVHTRVEEEIFYPAAYEAFSEPDMLDEAVVEHATAKDLIAQIESMVGADALYDAKVKVLGEYINHHIEEEEKEMFPKCRRARMDLEGLGEAIAYRKDELMAPMATH
jgi:hemerythrin-like domain-containing protein